MTNWTLIEKLSHMLADLLWFEMDRLHLFATVTTPIRHLSAFRIECGFPLFPKRWDIHEIKVGSRHRKIV